MATGCPAGSDDGQDPAATKDELFEICEETAACIPASCSAETLVVEEHSTLEPDAEDPAWSDWYEQLQSLSDERWSCVEEACFAPASYEEVNSASDDIECWEGQRLELVCALGLGLKAASNNDPGWCDNIYIDG